MTIEFFHSDAKGNLRLVTSRNGLRLSAVTVVHDGRAVTLGACPQEFRDEAFAEWSKLSDDSEVSNERLSHADPGDVVQPNAVEGFADDDAPSVSLHQL